MTKKILVIIMVLSISIMSYSFSNTNDYEKHWARNEINNFIENEFINLKNNNFKPNDFIRRGEFVRLVNNVYGYKQETNELFKDMNSSDHFFVDALIARNIGYISGYPDNTFRANQNITRQEAAKIFSEIMDLEDSELNFLKVFNDTESFPRWSSGYLNKVVKKRYLTGYPDGTLKPTNKITRAEAVKMIDNIIGEVITSTNSTLKGKVIENNAIVIEENLSLSDYTVKGDLIVSAHVNQGNFTLKNSTADGDTLILGGGENSIHLINTTLNKITLKKFDDQVRLVIDSKSKIQRLNLKSGAIIESQSELIENFEINSKDKNIKLIGKFNNIILNGKNNINLSDNTIIKEITLNNEAEINGDGTIEHIIANTSGSKIKVKTKKISLKNDVIITLNDKEITKNYEEAEKNDGSTANQSTSGGSTNPSVSNKTFNFIIEQTFLGSPTFDFKATLGGNIINGFDLIYNDLVIASDTDNDGLIRTLNVYNDIDNLVINYNGQFYKNNSTLNNSSETSNLKINFFKKITFKDAPTFDLKVSLNDSYLKGYDLIYNDKIIATDRDYDGIVRTINIYDDIDKLKIMHDGNIYIDSDNVFSDLN